MSRRTYSNRYTCAADGCRDTVQYLYDRRSEQQESLEFHKRHPYRCTRHSEPEKMLSSEVLTREHVATARRLVDGCADLFWDTEHNKVARGPGFRAFAGDFPEGTQLIITARIVPPTDEERSNG